MQTGKAETVLVLDWLSATAKATLENLVSWNILQDLPKWPVQVKGLNSTIKWEEEMIQKNQ